MPLLLFHAQYMRNVWVCQACWFSASVSLSLTAFDLRVRAHIRNSLPAEAAATDPAAPATAAAVQRRAPRLWNIHLQVRRFISLRGRMQPQVQRHLVRCFAGARQPAWKCVLPKRLSQTQMVRTNPNVGQPIGNRTGRPQLALPRIHGDPLRSNPSRRHDVLASGQPRRRDVPAARRVRASVRSQSLARHPAPPTRCRTGTPPPCRASQTAPLRCTRQRLAKLLLGLRRRCGSSAANGPSSSSASGSIAMHRAIATRCLCPPEISPACAQPAPQCASARLPADSHSPLRLIQPASPKPAFSSTVRWGNSA